MSTMIHSACTARPQRNAGSVAACRRNVRVAAHGTKTIIPPGYLGDLRKAAIKLHTREQLGNKGKDSKKADPVEQPKRPDPTLLGYVRFLKESLFVFSTMERIVAESDDPVLSRFRSNGLERTGALKKDLEWFLKEKGVEVADKPDGPGTAYGKLLTQLAKDDVPAFMCHYYNINFAHTSGGRMIGTAMSKNLLDGHELEFYKYDGDMKEIGDKVKAILTDVSESWTKEESKRSVEQTPDCFACAGSLMRCITQSCDCDCVRA